MHCQLQIYKVWWTANSSHIPSSRASKRPVPSYLLPPPPLPTMRRPSLGLDESLFIVTPGTINVPNTRPKGAKIVSHALKPDKNGQLSIPHSLMIIGWSILRRRRSNLAHYTMARNTRSVFSSFAHQTRYHQQRLQQLKSS